MMLWKIGAVHGHSLLSKKHPEKASRDTLRKQGQSSLWPFLRHAGQMADNAPYRPDADPAQGRRNPEALFQNEHVTLRRLRTSAQAFGSGFEFDDD